MDSEHSIHQLSYGSVVMETRTWNSDTARNEYVLQLIEVRERALINSVISRKQKKWIGRVIMA